MRVAIDGPAGVGKSTIAKAIAEKCGFFYLNTGSFYRAYTYNQIVRGGDVHDPKSVLENAHKVKLSIQDGNICIDGVNVEDKLHTPQVDAAVATVSVDPALRSYVNEQLRAVSEGMDVIAEGRDITTVVFPDAEVKCYFDASPEVRAKRRLAQHPENGSYEAVLASIKERDEIDKNKKVGALKKADDALYIDTSYLTIDSVCERVLSAIFRCKNNQGNRNFRIRRNQVAEEEKIEEEKNKIHQMMEDDLKSLDEIEDGQLVTGTVVQVNNETVFLDVGYKSEGRISTQEFTEIPKVGDKVEVVVISKEGKGGGIVVSKKRADFKKRTDELKAAADNHTPVMGKFDKVIKGGYEVDLGGDYRGFCPLSKADVQHVEDPESLIGVSDYFMIDKFHSGTKLKSVVNRREYLDQMIKANKEKFFANVKIGDVVQGVVKSFTSFGAFIDLGGFDGLLHINDMSWGHVTRPKDFVKKGEVVKLRLINIDPETQKINLSLKHMTQDPWTTFEERYHVNDVVTRKVTKITTFGAFIELEPGIEGLAHISEMSWTKHINDPHEVLSVGQEVNAKILGYDLDKKRVSLGLKQLQENPWDTIGERYPVGTTLSRPVVKVTNSGAFINLEEGIDGFLHVDDVSWTKKVKTMSSFCKEGDVLDVVVTKVEPENRRIRLSVKQLEGNPWQQLRHDFPKGSTITGTVSNVTDFGVFVKVQGDIEGLISKFNLVGPNEEYTDDVLKKFKVGDPVSAAVLECNPTTQKLSLSIKEMLKKKEQSEIAKYMSEEKDDSESFTLADLMKAKDR